MLDDAKALSGAFDCAGNHDEPFRRILGASARNLRPDSDFERKVRSEREANCAITKASEQIRWGVLSISSPRRQSVVRVVCSAMRGLPLSAGQSAKQTS